MHGQIRQGDVLLVPTKEDPTKMEDAKEVDPINGQLVLAYGEASGHMHAIPAGNHAHMYETAVGMFLVLTKAAQLMHQEHAPHDLPAQTYEVRRQRERRFGRDRVVQD